MSVWIEKILKKDSQKVVDRNSRYNFDGNELCVLKSASTQTVHL